MYPGNENRLTLGNGLTLDELEQIEEAARRSHTSEAEIILRLSAGLREAMQVRDNAVALLDLLKARMVKSTAREKAKTQAVRNRRGQTAKAPLLAKHAR